MIKKLSPRRYVWEHWRNVPRLHDEMVSDMHYFHFIGKRRYFKHTCIDVYRKQRMYEKRCKDFKSPPILKWRKDSCSIDVEEAIGLLDGIERKFVDLCILGYTYEEILLELSLTKGQYYYIRRCLEDNNVFMSRLILEGRKRND